MYGADLKESFVCLLPFTEETVMMAASVASSRGLSSSDMAVVVGVKLSYTSVGVVSCR